MDGGIKNTVEKTPMFISLDLKQPPVRIQYDTGVNAALAL